MTSVETLEIQEAVDESIEDAWRNFDEECWHYLGMSGKSFISAYRSGALVDDDTPANFNVGWLAGSIYLFE